MQQSEIKEIIKLQVDLSNKLIANYKYLEENFRAHLRI
jgi:hypothetical protein